MGYDRALLLHLATSDRLERTVKAVPGGQRAAWRAAPRYVAGPALSDAPAAAGTLFATGHSVSIDLFGERIDDAAVADRVADEYVALAGAIAGLPADRAWLSLDPSP